MPPPRAARPRSLSSSPQSGPVADVPDVASDGLELWGPASRTQHSAGRIRAGHGAAQGFAPLPCSALCRETCAPGLSAHRLSTSGRLPACATAEKATVNTGVRGSAGTEVFASLRTVLPHHMACVYLIPQETAKLWLTSGLRSVTPRATPCFADGTRDRLSWRCRNLQSCRVVPPASLFLSKLF